MALNEIFKDADSLDYPVASTVESGDLVAVGTDLIGVAETDAKAARDGGGYYATLRHVGVFEFNCTTTGAVAVGALLYAPPADLTAGTSDVTTTSTSNTLVGVAVKAKPSGGAGPVWVRINN
jgi:predicted RecA/RadA family phage recombinase